MSNDRDTADQPFDPRDALRVMGDQEAASARELRYPDHLLYLVWGTVYLLGYLPLALSRGPEALVEIPLGVSIGFFFVALAAGLAITITVSARQGRGVRGASARQGMLYGYSWWLAFVGIAGLGYRLGEIGIADGDQIGLVVNGVSMILVGTQFMAGGAIWNGTTQFVIGAVVCAITTLGLVLGLPAYYWIMALVVGGGFLVVGVVLVLRGRRS